MNLGKPITECTFGLDGVAKTAAGLLSLSVPMVTGLLSLSVVAGSTGVTSGLAGAGGGRPRGVAGGLSGAITFRGFRALHGT